MRLLAAAMILVGLGGASSPPALTSHSMQFGGRTRTWSEFVPAACAKVRCMTVVMLHGGHPDWGRGRTPPIQQMQQTADRLAASTGITATAAREGFVVLIPTAVAGNWNDGRPGIADQYDDVGFLRAMLLDAGHRTMVSPDRTFVTGGSNGGLMSFRMACDASDVVRAIGPVVANLGEALSQHCPKAQPVDIIQIVGMRDPIMPYAGGAVAGTRGGTLSAAQTLAFWTARLTKPVSGERRFSSDVTLRTVRSPDGRIEQYSVGSWGHAWPKASDPAVPEGGGGNRGSNPSHFDATTQIVAFFKGAPPR